VTDSDKVVAARGARQALESLMTGPARWKPLPHQVPPSGSWYGWLLRAGRGAGKTDACARYVNDHVNGPPCMPGPIPHWIGIIAPTKGDAATACFSGPSGIRAHNPDAVMKGGAGGLAVYWPNGSEAKMFGAHTPDDVERLRAGGNRCLVWCEELAAWRHLDECWDHMTFGLRIGKRPHWVASTTPKPRLLIKNLIKGGVRNVIVTHATTYDNPHLPEDLRLRWEERYGGTTLGSQELMGELIEQDENALWRREWIERNRLKSLDRDLHRISVGVDPSGGVGEQGIVVVGKYAWNEPAGKKIIKRVKGYTLDDRSCHLSPNGWGKRAAQAAVDWEADDICVEINFGGDMAVSVLRGACEALGVSIPIRKVTASRGKRVRAEPVAALAERGNWHHLGVHEALEDQLCVWYPELDWSPDRLDAMVWPAWHMKLATTSLTVIQGGFGGTSMATQVVT